MTMPAPSLRMSAGPVAGWMLVTVEGELDYASCPELTRQLETVIGGQPRPRVAVDVAGLDFCDSSGLRCLAVAWKRVQQRDGEFLIVKPSPNLRWKIKVTGLNTILRAAEELPG